MAIPWRLSIVLIGLAELLLPVRVPAPFSYDQAVRLYREGNFEEAMAMVQGMALADRTRGADAFVKRTLSLRPVPVFMLEAALALNTEATIASERPLPCAAPAEPPDGWPHGMPLPLKRSQLQEELEDTSARMPDYAFLLAWYRLTAAYNQGRGDLHNALVCLETAPKRTTADPEIFLALGAVHETAWHLLEQDQVKTNGVEPDLKVAESAYRSAIAGAPPAQEARVRLGRVLTLRSDPTSAVAQLGDPESYADRDLQYLGFLFLGYALEKQASYDQARSSYRRARGMLPSAQSAALAEASLAYALGRRAEAATIVRELASGSTSDRSTDPWLWYGKGTAKRTAGYLTRVREIVTRH